MRVRKLVHCCLAGLLLVICSGTVSAGILAGHNSETLPGNDDGSTGLVALGFGANFFGTTYTDLYVNNNGNVTFGDPLGQFTPFGLSGATLRPIIAPFFADVDTRLPAGLEVTYGTGTLGPNSASFGVNWIDVDYFVGSHPSQLNTFQLRLIDRSDIAAGDFDICFAYDQITWETGDASGGVGGLGGESARVGYSNGTGLAGTFFEQAGSGVNGAFLNGGPNALIDLPGMKLLFQVRSGNVTQAVPEPSTFALGGIGLILSLATARRRRAISK